MKKNKIVLFLSLFSICFIILFSSFSQAFQWEKTFGSEMCDDGQSIQQTFDNGYIIAGNTSVSGNYDVWLIKTDVNGNEEWNQIFSWHDVDRGYSVQQTADGGYIVGGYTESFGDGHGDALLLKTDSEGTQEWVYTFGGDNTDSCNEVRQTTDGGYILIGNTESFGAGSNDIWLIKTDSEGNEVWNKTFGSESTDIAGDVIQVENDCYIVTGGSGDCQICLIKTDSEGNEIWTKYYGEYPEYPGIGRSVKQKSDGGYIITGVLSSVWVSDVVLLLSTDAQGNYLWHNTFYKQGTFDPNGCSVDITDDGGFFITGYACSNESDFDFWLIKTNSEGYKQWDMLIGGVDRDQAYCGQQTVDGGYIAVGFTRSYGAGYDDVYLVYFNPVIPGVPISCTEIIISTLTLLLLAISPIFLKKNLNYNKKAGLD